MCGNDVDMVSTRRGRATLNDTLPFTLGDMGLLHSLQNTVEQAQ